jgi:hypothetical protein
MIVTGQRVTILQTPRTVTLSIAGCHGFVENLVRDGLNKPIYSVVIYTEKINNEFPHFMLYEEDFIERR